MFTYSSSVLLNPWCTFFLSLSLLDASIFIVCAKALYRIMRFDWLLLFKCTLLFRLFSTCHFLQMVILAHAVQTLLHFLEYVGFCITLGLGYICLQSNESLKTVGENHNFNLLQKAVKHVKVFQSPLAFQ